MNEPPAAIDGATVLWWAWSDEPIGHCRTVDGPPDDPDDGAVFGIAICSYGDGKFYRISCDADWESITDSDHDSEDEAKQQLPIDYELAKIRWIRRAG